jgi:tetratricopeptide (TPR) repeat protein
LKRWGVETVTIGTRIAAALLAGLILVPASAGPVEGEGIDPAVNRRGEAYFHLMKAMFVARKGQVGQAIREINEAVGMAPDSVDLKAEAGSLLMVMGQQQQAERLVRQALKDDPDHKRSLEILAEILTGRILGGRSSSSALAEVINVYDRLTLTPDVDPEHFRLLTTLRLRAGDVEGAIQAARRYVNHQEGDAQAVRLLANVLRHADRDEEAVDEVVRFLRETEGLDDESDGFRDTVALLDNLIRSRNVWQLFVDRAVPLLKARPQAAGIRALYGESLLRVGRPAEAGEQMERAIGLAGADPMLRFQLATVYSTLGRIADAVELATGLAEEFPGHHGVQNLLGDVLAQQGRNLEAIVALEQAIEILKEDGTEAVRRDALRQQIIRLWLSAGEPERARDVLAGLENPASMDALNLAGRVALVLQDYAGALEFAQRLQRGSEDGAGILLQAEIRAASGETGKARKLFDEASRFLGNSVWPIAADALFRAGEPEEGEELLRTWRDQEPDNPWAYFSLGQYLEQRENFRQMEKEMREAIRLNPEFADALNHLGYSMADRNVELDKALAYINRAIDLDPWNAAYLDSLGWVYYRMGEYEKARRPLETAAGTRPADAVVLEHLGDLYEKLGLAESALSSWRTALAADPAGQEHLEAKIAALLQRGDGDRP